MDLSARILQALARRTGVDPAWIEDVIWGCAIPAGEQSGNMGRQAVLAAGWPAEVPAVTLDRKWGSSQQAMDFAAQGILAGAYDLVVAGVAEMMSGAPMKSNRMGMDEKGPMHHACFPEGPLGQGISAELIAARWGCRGRSSTPLRCGRTGSRQRRSRGRGRHRAAGDGPGRGHPHGTER